MEQKKSWISHLQNSNDTIIYHEVYELYVEYVITRKNIYRYTT